MVDAFVGLIRGKPAATEAPPLERVAGTDALCAGMVLARDLVTRDGVLLLARDYILDDLLIRQIRDYEQSEGATLKVHLVER